MQLSKDIFTGESFLPKRKNQKFKNAKNRVEYHNSKAQSINKLKSFVLEPLHRNHKILMEIIPAVGKPVSFSKEFLTGRGYNLMVMTHYEMIDGKSAPSIFNFSYLDLLENKNTLTIIRNS